MGEIDTMSRHDELTVRGKRIRAYNVAAPFVQGDARDDMARTMYKRCGIRIDDIMLLATLRRRPGKAYVEALVATPGRFGVGMTLPDIGTDIEHVEYLWKLTFSSPHRFTERRLQTCEALARYVLNDDELDSVSEPSDHSDLFAVFNVYCLFLPVPAVDGYLAAALPGKDEATYTREEVDGERKVLVAGPSGPQ
jgi:hypothetical protein